MKIKDLTPNERNPRKMSTQDKMNLQKSLRKFGDLSGIIFNRTSKRLVGGHQRSSVLPQDSTIKIETKHDSPTAAGTVAEGYALIDGEKFKYREVEWDKKTETEALIAANKHSGDWDNEKLRLNFADFPDLDIEAIGFDISELDDFGISFNIEEALDDAFESLEDEETDEQYLRKNKGPDYEADRERLPDMVKRTANNNDTTPADVKEIDPDADNPFEDAGKTTDVVSKRHVLIIDFDSAEDKEKLKGEIRPLVEEMGAKFF